MTALLNISEPLVRTTVFRGVSAVYFYGIDPDDETTNWSFNIKDINSLKKHITVLAPTVKKLLLPDPKFANTKLVYPEAMAIRGEINGVKLFGGVNADGCIFVKNKSQDMALAMATADCSLIVAQSNDGKIVIASHGARNSVIDRGVIEVGIPYRQTFGVIDAILTKMARYGYTPHEVFWGIYGGIRKNFKHPPQNHQHGIYNCALIAFCRSLPGVLLDSETGDIDMYCLIRELAHQKGVPYTNITFDDIDTGSNPRCASHRNGTKGWRNLIVVYPCWN